MKVGLLGFGKVGGVVAGMLLDRQGQQPALRELRLTKIGVRDLSRRGGGLDADAELWECNLEKIVLDPEIDVIIELLGGVEPPRRLIARALEHRKHVITANRPLMAHYGRELLEYARAQGVCLAFEGSVGCGIPIIGSLISLQANSVRSITAIVNSTSNYLLTEISRRGKSFQAALDAAIELRLVEPDARNDLDGLDSGEKLIIMVLVAFRMQIRIGDIEFQSLNGLDLLDVHCARQRQYSIKQLAVAESVAGGGFRFRVGPHLVANDDLLSRVDGAVNAISIVADPVGPLFFYGKGASPEATASAVLADLLGIAWQSRTTGSLNGVRELFRQELVNHREQRYYLRCSSDRITPATLSLIGSRFDRSRIAWHWQLKENLFLFTEPITWPQQEHLVRSLNETLKTERTLSIPIFDGAPH